MKLVVDIELDLQLYCQTGLFYLCRRNRSAPNGKYTLYPENVEAEREAEALWSVSGSVLAEQHEDMLRQDVYICLLF